MKKIIVVISIGISILSCNKKNNTPVEYPINDTLKAHYNYQVGSYWIYMDSISGEEDSFYVTSNVLSKQKVSDEEIYDNIYISIKQQPENPFKTIITDWYFSIGLRSFSIGIGIDYYIYPVVTYPISVGPLSSSNSWGYVQSLYTIFTLKGNTFSNVACIHDSIPNHMYNDRFYINDSVEIIKMNLNHPNDTTYRVWELERWKVIK